jgi:ribosomal protein S18 acetylase RimI-like enzyme
MHFREATHDDTRRIFSLYKAVAADRGGIARSEDEVSEEYVAEFVERSTNDGLIIVCEHPDDPDRIVAELHAYRSGLRVFSHVLTDLTIAVHPDFQGKKIGRTLFTIFLKEIVANHSDIGKVELITREGNSRAISLYLSLGFVIEGRMEMRIRTPSGGYEADIPMGWRNPNFEFD